MQYPNEFIELVRIVSSLCRKRDVARALALPLSSVYRWADADAHKIPETHLIVLGEDMQTARLRALVDVCEQYGFDVRRAVKLLLPAFSGEMESSQTSDTKRLSDSAQETRTEISTAAHRISSTIRQIASTPDAPSRGRPALKSRLLSAKAGIDLYYYTRLSIGGLAAAVGMTKFNFTRAFRAMFDVAPYQYVNQVRVERAKHMMMLTRQPLELVAASVGFSSSSSLSRAFKRFEGANPSRVFHKMASSNLRRPSASHPAHQHP